MSPAETPKEPPTWGRCCARVSSITASTRNGLSSSRRRGCDRARSNAAEKGEWSGSTEERSSAVAPGAVAKVTYKKWSQT